MVPSSFTEFARKVNGSGWSKRHIRRKFLKQVDREDYSKSDMGELINWLTSIGKKV